MISEDYTFDIKQSHHTDSNWELSRYRTSGLSDDLYGESYGWASPTEPLDGRSGLWPRLLAFTRKNKLYIACLVYVIMDILTTVHYKRLMDHTGNYAMVTMEALIFYFWCFFATIYAVCNRYYPRYMSEPFDVRPLLVMCAFDTTATALSSVGSVNTSGIRLVLLGQIGIPLTIVACKVILGRRYHFYQYLGSGLIVAFVVLKELTMVGSSANNDFRSNLIYMASCIPDSIASALRSGQYSSGSFHLVKYQLSASTLQVIFGLPVFTFYISRHRTRPDLGFLSGLVHDLQSGLACLFLGRNTIIENCGVEGMGSCDNCEGALGIFFIYLLCNMIIRAAYIVIMMHGTVTLVFLLGTLKVPLCSIAFSLRAISGDSATAFDFTDVFCFVGIMLSLLLYGFGTKQLETTSNDLAEPMLPPVRASSLGGIDSDDLSD
ncbi:chloroquine resistance transporter [Babesia caballi]|uniref:Chloroquine resistance transporter n=1 Tax=Babesia caballi TaxID=5871 RepID=A0AAV4LPC1_BABCB|nr:chloroquine resistance transporter [Babesia caballi]